MKIIKTLIFFITVAFCYALTGLLLVGPGLFNMESTAKYNLVFCLTAILFITILRFWRISDFIYIGMLVSMFIVFVWSHDNTFQIIIRNSLWFITTGILTYLSYRILNMPNLHKLLVIKLVVWIVALNLIYFIMLMVNIFVFDVYRINSELTFVFYLKHALRFGTIYGLGIGLGYILADFVTGKLESSEN
jgi:hypothetical protein